MEAQALGKRRMRLQTGGFANEAVAVYACHVLVCSDAASDDHLYVGAVCLMPNRGIAWHNLHLPV